MNLFRELSADDTAEFRAWARASYKPLTEIKGFWHPAVQAECVAINAEYGADLPASELECDDASDDDGPTMCELFESQGE